MAIRVALASNDGVMVDQHFGYARHFTVADIADGTFETVEIRTVPIEFTKGGCGECGHHTDECEVPMEEKFKGVLTTLFDCRAIFVYRIGQGAVYYLLKQGIRVFQVYGMVDEILNHVIQNGLLEEEGEA